MTEQTPTTKLWRGLWFICSFAATLTWGYVLGVIDQRHQTDASIAQTIESIATTNLCIASLRSAVSAN